LSSDVAVQIKRISGSSATPTPVGTDVDAGNQSRDLPKNRLTDLLNNSSLMASLCLGTGIVSALSVPPVAIYLYRNRAAFSKRYKNAHSPHSSSGQDQHANRWNNK